MSEYTGHKLARWIGSNAGSELSLAGSLGALGSMTLNELINLSTDPKATTEALQLHNINLAGATGEQGGLKLREQIASLHESSEVKITADDVIVVNATTGANLLVLQSLISPGDHVVTMYPNYAPLIEIPRQLGADMSYWRLDPNNNWQGHLSDLKSLLKPTTRLLILNNPHNPTGSVLSTSAQKSILALAAEHNIPVLCDEIFRPLFFPSSSTTTTTTNEIPTSLLHHPTHPQTLITSSLSKAWCYSGVRIGWVITTSPTLKRLLIAKRSWILEATSILDEVIATEILHPRCRVPILNALSARAKANRAALAGFVAKYADVVQCSLPAGGSTAFVRFVDPRSGEPVDDLEFCKVVKSETGVLLSPGGHSFGLVDKDDFKGYVRVHLTQAPETVEMGLERVGEFVGSERFREWAAREDGVKVNGSA